MVLSRLLLVSWDGYGLGCFVTTKLGTGSIRFVCSTAVRTVVRRYTVKPTVLATPVALPPLVHLCSRTYNTRSDSSRLVENPVFDYGKRLSPVRPRLTVKLCFLFLRWPVMTKMFQL